MKYIGVPLAKHIWNPYTESFKTPMKEIKEDLSNGAIMMRRLNIGPHLSWVIGTSLPITYSHHLHHNHMRLCYNFSLSCQSPPAKQ